MGTTVMMAARFGIARGLFSNESGWARHPLWLQRHARAIRYVRLWFLLAARFGIRLLSVRSPTVLVSSIIAYPEIDHTQGGALTKMAFGKIPYIGPAILSVGILTFAFSTILGWSYYGEKAMEIWEGRSGSFIIALPTLQLHSGSS
jgi:AGCS family alanine or glycine:cation symporter